MKKLLIAFTAGAILGMLYAPAKGEKTRKKLANLGNDAKDRWNSITDSVADRVESIRDKIDDIADKAVEKVEGTRFDVAPHA